jgi:hypothetical protein
MLSMNALIVGLLWVLAALVAFVATASLAN